MAGQGKGQGGGGGGMADETTAMNPGDEAPPGTTGTGEAVCPDCHGTGKLSGGSCPTCGGTGKVVEGIGGG